MLSCGGQAICLARRVGSSESVGLLEHYMPNNSHVANALLITSRVVTPMDSKLSITVLTVEVSSQLRTLHSQRVADWRRTVL